METIASGIINRERDRLILLKEKCIECRLCEEVCPSGAVSIDEKEINYTKCIGCYQCYAVCKSAAIEMKDFRREKVREVKIKPADLKDFFINKRSIRTYKDMEIESDKLKEITDILRYSPTATNSQAVFATVINRKDEVKHLGDSIAAYFASLTSMINKITLPLIKLLAGKKIALQLGYLKKISAKHKSGNYNITQNAPAMVLFHSPAASMEDYNCIYATSFVSNYAESMGIGSCINGFAVNALKRNKKLREKYKIPSDHNVYSALMLGYTKNKYFYRVPRAGDKVSFYQ